SLSRRASRMARASSTSAAPPRRSRRSSPSSSPRPWLVTGLAIFFRLWGMIGSQFGEPLPGGHGRTSGQGHNPQNYGVADRNLPHLVSRSAQKKRPDQVGAPRGRRKLKRQLRYLAAAKFFATCAQFTTSHQAER